MILGIKHIFMLEITQKRKEKCMKTKKLFVLLLAFCLLMTSLAGCADILSLLSPDPDYLS